MMDCKYGNCEFGNFSLPKVVLDNKDMYPARLFYPTPHIVKILLGNVGCPLSLYSVHTTTTCNHYTQVSLLCSIGTDIILIY